MDSAHREVYIPRADTPWADIPLLGGHPPPQADTPPLARRPLQRMVRLLLEMHSCSEKHLVAGPALRDTLILESFSINCATIRFETRS